VLWHTEVVTQAAPQRVIGRYALFQEIAAGGMATVHLGRLMGPVGFSRTVAIKRLHAQFAKDPEFVSMFLDEARLAARVIHPNVVSILDVVALDGELFLVMDYVQGESMSRLLKASAKRGERVPPRIAIAIITGVLYGLHAAHDATNEMGEPLGLVHRDVSPQNILVGVDGTARVLDFGVAKAVGQSHSTKEGTLKGKVPYMAPEQLNYGVMDRRTDIYAAATVLWEMLTGRRLFDGPTEASMLAAVMGGKVTPAGAEVPQLPRAVDDAIIKGLSPNPASRFATARDLAIALERAMPPAIPRQVGDWVESLATDILKWRADQIKEVESVSASNPQPQGGLMPSGVDPTAPPPHREEASWGTGRSQIASVRPDAKQSDRTWKWIVLGLGGVGLTLLAIAIVMMAMLLRSRGPDQASAAPVPTVAAVPQSPRASASDAPAASVAPSASAGVKPPVKAQPAKSAPTVAKPPAGNCNPPYTVDSNGFHVPKPECL
jgi:eukaryotic-like serine/threonine-protein kinase